MSGKRLLPLVIVLGVLIILAVFLKRPPAPTRLAEEVGFERLVPQTLQSDQITGVDLYQGSTPEAVVRLRRQEGTWIVASYANAPVKASKIKEFLEAIPTLEGELRSAKPELLGAFQLETAQALHLLVYTTSAETPAIHLLAGKSQGLHGFMRTADETRVYSVNLNLHAAAGLYGTAEAPLEAKPWLELQIQDVPAEQITAVAIESPERRWRFTRQPVSPAATPPAAQGSEPGPTSGDTPGQATAALPWTLVEPAVAYAVNQASVDSLVSTLRTLRADDIADPAQHEAFGLEPPAYRAILTLQSAAQETPQATLLIGAEVQGQTGKRYARLEQGGPVYLLPPWSVSRLVMKTSDLLDLPGLDLQDPEIDQITLSTPARTVRLARSRAATVAAGEAAARVWTLVEPSLPFPLRQEGVEALARRLSTFTPDDLAPAAPSTPTEPSDAWSHVEVTLHDGSRHRIRVGSSLANRPQQSYVYLDEQETPFAIDTETRRQLIPALGALANLIMVQVQAPEVTRLSYQQQGVTWTLERRAGQAEAGAGQAVSTWQLIDTPQTPVDEQAVTTLLEAARELKAEDWLAHPSEGTGLEPPGLVLTLTLRSNRTITLALGEPLATAEGGHYARLQGMPGVFVLSPTTFKVLTDTLSRLRTAAASTPPTPSTQP